DEYLETFVEPLGRAVIWFSRGLAFDLFGRFDQAYKVLEQGETNLQDWDENQGKEVFYFFKGSEALFLSQCEADAAKVFPATADESAAIQALNKAEAAFKEAKRIQPAYPRAYLGLAQVNVQRAQRLLLPPGAKPLEQCRAPNNPAPSSTTPLSCRERTTGFAAPEQVARAAELRRAAVDLNAQAVALMQGSADELLLHRIQAAH